MKLHKNNLPRVLVMALLLGYCVQTSAIVTPDPVDRILKIISQVESYINNFVLTYGAQARALMDYAQTLMKLNAQKNGVSAEAYAKAIVEGYKLKQNLQFDFKVGERRLVVGGRTVTDGAMAPGACIQHKYNQWKKKRMAQRQKRIKEALERLRAKMAGLPKDTTTIMDDVYNLAIQSEVPLNVGDETVLPYNQGTRKAIEAQTSVMVYREPVVDIAAIDPEKIDLFFSSVKGVNGLIYAMTTDVISSTMIKSRMRNVEVAEGESDATQQIRDNAYLSNAKRVISEHAKSKKGVAMERYLLLTRELNAALRENEQLRQRRRLLMVTTLRRVRKLGDAL